MNDGDKRQSGITMADWDERANEIFLTAVELPTAEARTEYVTAACNGNLALRLQVTELLQANDAAGDFLETPVGCLPASLQPEVTRLTHIGPYRIVEPLGEGGMGVVFRAVQEAPVRRVVALKVIKPGMDSRQVIARFEAERQALALMEHPHIARVLDAGATAQGRPYFVMELVPGVPITDFCRQHRLTLRARLRLVVQVCQAVSHAHQKGIIHRDLKPSNILVSQADAQPQVKVIDFGVAKAIEQRLTEKTLSTGFTQLVGTPAYMSPEQLQTGQADIDTRSDVYSLGVLLYELLTGSLPFTDELLREVGRDAFRRIICEDDPPRPSVRATATSAEAATRSLGYDSFAPRNIGQLLRGELDWIVMQALEKDRARRYESASELASDLERFLRDEPVRACPPTKRYLLQKFARRHRVALSTGVLVVLALVIGTAISTWQAFDAIASRKLADERWRESQLSLQAASLARQEANHERDKARANAEQARSLLYASDVRMALEAWQANDVRKLRELLARHIPAAGAPDLRGFEWHFLWRHTSVKSRRVLQSDRPLYCVKFSPNGETVAVSGADGCIRLLSARTFALQHTLETTHGEVNGVEFSPDGTEFASVGDDGMLVLWELATGRPRLSFRVYDQAAFHVMFVDGMLMTCGRHPDIRLWNLQTGQLERELRQHSQTVQSIARSSRGHIAAGSDDDLVSCWDLAKPSAWWVKDSLAPVDAVSFSAVGDLLAAGDRKGVLRICRPEDGGVGVVEQQLPDAVQSLAFSSLQPDSPLPWLAVGDQGGSIHLILLHNVITRTGLLASSPERLAIRQLQGHAGRVYALAFTPDSRQLLSAGEDGQLRVWDIESDLVSRPIDTGVEDFAILDDSHVATVGQQLLLHDLNQFDRPRELLRLSSPGRHVSYDAAQGRIVFSDRDQRILATSREGSQPVLLAQADSDQTFEQFALSPDGRRLAAVVTNGGTYSVTFPDLSEGARFRCTSLVHDLAFSPDGACVLFDQEKHVQVIGFPDAQSTDIWSGHRSTIWELSMSRDGRHFASVSRDRQARVWEWPAGEVAWSKTAHAIDTDHVAFTPDGQTLATIGADRFLRLWRWQADMLVLEYPLADWPVQKLAFTPDGRKLLVLSQDRLRLYDSAGPE